MGSAHPDTRTALYTHWMVPYIVREIREKPLYVRDQIDAALRDGRWSVRLEDVGGAEWCIVEVDGADLVHVKVTSLAPPAWGAEA